MSELKSRALVKSGPGQVSTSVIDVDVRSPAAGEVRLRVEACGLCGSDVHAWRGDHGYEWVKTPVVLGHEMVGIVATTGDNVEASWRGRRVVPIGIDGCHSCASCENGTPQICPHRKVMGLSFDGGCAAFVNVPSDRLVEVDAAAPAARMTLTEPMSVASRAVRRLGEIASGTKVIVSGPGPIGLFAAWLLTRRGVDVTLTGTESDENLRLPAARRLGIRSVRGDQVSTDEQIGAWIEASGSVGGFQQAVDTLAPGGRLVVVALFAEDPRLEINTVVRREIELVGAYASLREDYELAATALAGTEGFEDIVSTVLPLTEGVKALEATASGQVVKAVLVP